MPSDRAPAPPTPQPAPQPSPQPSPQPPPLAARDVLCVTCGVERTVSAAEPGRCPVCDDERQYVGAGGQRWTDRAALAREHRNTWDEVEPGLWSIRTAPAFAIGHRALLVATPAGNVLWDCLSVVDDETVAAVRARGGLAAIALSHPHFYGAMRAWSRAFGDAPIWVHDGDRAWVPEPAPQVRTWSGSSLELIGGLRLVHTGGHFAGSQVLHWPAGAEGRGVVLAGDQPNVCADRRWVTFMRSYPTYIPLAAHDAQRVASALLALPFDRLYSWTPDRVLATGARDIVARSVERHVRALRGEHATVPPIAAQPALP